MQITRLRRVVFNALRSLASVLMISGLTVREIVELVKAASVDAARQSASKHGQRVSIASIARTTGLTRKEVRRLIDVAALMTGSRPKFTPTHMSLLLHKWHTLPKYLDDRGMPRPLDIGPGENSLTALIEEELPELDAVALISKLRSSGTVEGSETLMPVKRNYSMSRIEQDLAMVIDSSFSTIGKCVSHNVNNELSDRWLQRVVYSEALSHRQLGIVRRSVRDRATSFCHGIDDLFGAHRSVEGNSSAAGQAHAGIGVYYFEDSSGE